ncbi:hypothetical protein SAMN05421594_0965 [Chryseobacterium oleae]|uniref:Uncharacterized protein n=1 Tax=Chryseobacterium oleae TaxID=491207 RepID=A0A1I4W871_CHROL|nr:hypothetical protein [Chryseobacterium oleae]SFN09209.1 hypothetical protein SAMN05421594_0965 [Chryseobacterium oleae]
MYKEFGLWKEYGVKYQNFPSINLYINEEVNALYDKDKLINYLNLGGIVAATSAMNFPHLFTKEIRSGAFLILTDGIWSWPDDLPEYVLNYNVIIPNDWYDYIIKNEYQISEEIKNLHKDVDWGS